MDQPGGGLSVPAVGRACSEGGAGARRVRVLVAGDDACSVVVARVLGASSLLEVVGEAREGDDALERSAELEPDVVVIDLPLLRRLTERPAATADLSAAGLTGRELEVLSLVAQSKTNRQIAANLYISENTVKNHVRNILEKLHLHSRMEAVTYAWRNRMLGPADSDSPGG